MRKEWSRHKKKREGDTTAAAVGSKKKRKHKAKKNSSRGNEEAANKVPEGSLKCVPIKTWKPMQDTIIPEMGEVQHLYFPADHPEHPGHFKSMAVLLQEHGLYDEARLNSECKRFICPVEKSILKKVCEA
uniref:Uncharacterized protein n=1 Tax=Moniliophthora roreri TaxID=221103 RepID=A0A0W0FHX9_MONRR